MDADDGVAEAAVALGAASDRAGPAHQSETEVTAPATRDDGVDGDGGGAEGPERSGSVFERMREQLRRAGVFASARAADGAGGPAASTAAAASSAPAVTAATAHAAPDPMGLLDEHLRRVDAFLAGTLRPYPHEEVRDTHGAKARRVIETGLKLLKYYNPLAGLVEAALPASEYGMAAFVFRKDLREMVSTILQLLASIERDAGVGKLNARKSAVALYYIAAYKRLERWAEPDSEELEHASGRSGVLEQVASDETVDMAGRFLSLANLSYAADRPEAEYKAYNLEYELVLSHPLTSPCQPAFCLVASRKTRTAVLSIRGTNSIQDIFTDGKANAVPLLDGFCHEGMVAAANWMLESAGLLECATRLSRSGFKIALTGHSLGGGVALVCGLLMSESMANVSVFTFGTPACFDETLANREWVRTNVHCAILRDDLSPRVSVANVARLAQEIVGREDMIAQSFDEDVDAISRRMKTLWAPPHRTSKLWAPERKLRDPASASASPDHSDEEKDNDAGGGAAAAGGGGAAAAASSGKEKQQNSGAAASVGGGGKGGARGDPAASAAAKPKSAAAAHATESDAARKAKAGTGPGQTAATPATSATAGGGATQSKAAAVAAAAPRATAAAAGMPKAAAAAAPKAAAAAAATASDSGGGGDVKAAAVAAPKTSADGKSWLSPNVLRKLPAWAQWRAKQAATPPATAPFAGAPPFPAAGPKEDGGSGGAGANTAPLSSSSSSSAMADKAGAADAAPADLAGWGPGESTVVDGVADRAASSIVRTAAAEAALELEGDAHESEWVAVEKHETRAPRMVPAGRLLHIYFYRGLYRASVVDHTFKPMRRIELQGNAPEDHTLEGMANALRTVKAARRAGREPPKWMSMTDPRARYCMVCFCEVTWATTSSSQAQHARTMRHCRACGFVVCPECSSHKMTLPELGIVTPSRVCDRCFWSVGL